MAEAEGTIPAPQTPAEIAIHIGYLRRDIASIGESHAAGMKEILQRIEGLAEHYVSAAEFEPIVEQVSANKNAIAAIKEWKDNLNGKMIGFATGISAASASASAILVKLFGG